MAASCHVHGWASHGRYGGNEVQAPEGPPNFGDVLTTAGAGNTDVTGAITASRLIRVYASGAGYVLITEDSGGAAATTDVPIGAGSPEYFALRGAGPWYVSYREA